MEWLDALSKNHRRGSFPRCLLFMEGDRAIVADKLTKLVGLPGICVEAKDFWMPQGLPVLKENGEWDTNPIKEAKLGESTGFLCGDQRKEVTSWWLAVRKLPNIPHWDIASTCTIGGKNGLLLVEAKAHDAELKKDGKTLDKDASPGSIANHEQIRRAVGAVSAGLNELNKAIGCWNLSLDSNYQLANRFAWAWKLASMGIPVVLVYLGFLCATEVNDLGKPLVDCADWSRVVLEHARNIVPERAWGRDIKVGPSTVNPLIRVWKQEFPRITAS